MQEEDGSSDGVFSGASAVLSSLRDELRSARNWRDLLTHQDRQTLLDEIARTALAVGRDISGNPSLLDLDLGDGGGDACPRERVAFLSRVWPQITNALTTLEREPPPTLVPSTRTVAFERARRIAPRDLLSAVRQGDFVPAAPTTPLASVLGGRLPRRISERIAVPTANTPASAAIKTLLTIWARDLASAVFLATAASAPDVAAEAERLRRRLRVHLAREPWCTLLPAPARTVSPLSVALRTHGAHRLLHDTYRRYRMGFAFDWNQPLFSLPSRETHLLYEYWCLFQTARALRALGFRAAAADDFRVSRAGLTFSLKKGNPSRLTFRHTSEPQTVSITYNCFFPRADAEIADGWYSRSHDMRPDIVLESGGKLLILDAKFKTYAEARWETEDRNQAKDALPARAGNTRRWHFAAGTMHPDIQQMHSYRDAIAHGSERGMVWGAWLLYAGRSEVSNPLVVSFPHDSENLFGNHELGAICLRPDTESKILQQLIFLFLNDGSTSN